jgi:thioredoxin reductase/Fe-S-cluster-containing hydrogenase component 2/bacterioferritin-associated ferredoxin
MTSTCNSKDIYSPPEKEVSYTHDLCIIGAGPAGMCAALAAAEKGVKSLLIDDGLEPGGQLIKQTHRFFGSEKHYASVRGIEIAAGLKKQINDSPFIELKYPCTAIGMFDNSEVACTYKGSTFSIRPRRIIAATGATEKVIAFEGSDLPGVCGAGAVQTLMNLYGVKPADRVLMIGAGNIGLIVAYQLLQAGVEVAAIVEASGEIGGYWVHADKIRRFDVPILTNHTIVRAFGRTEVTGAVIAGVDRNFKIIPQTEQNISCDTVCLAVGLTPLVDLLWQAGCRLNYVSELGGYVPVRNMDMRTTREDIFVAGDLAGIEEASAAMVEGRIAGLNAARDLILDARAGAAFQGQDLFSSDLADLNNQLALLRDGPRGAKTRAGILKMAALAGVNPPEFAAQSVDKPFQEHDENLYKKAGGVKAVIECYENIPCNPCVTACPVGAMKFPGGDSIIQRPVVDINLCTGCLKCLYKCPGLAIFAVDYSAPGDRGVLYIPWEMRPLPEKGESVDLLNRNGAVQGRGRIVKTISGKALNRTVIIAVEMDKALLSSVRNIRRIVNDDPVICRCEDLKKSEILSAIHSGLHSFDELKKVLRCGMGVCQGRTCQDIILRMIASETGRPLDTLAGQKKRPPSRPVTLKELAGEEK